MESKLVQYHVTSYKNGRFAKGRIYNNYFTIFFSLSRHWNIQICTRPGTSTALKASQFKKRIHLIALDSGRNYPEHPFTFIPRPSKIPMQSHIRVAKVRAEEKKLVLRWLTPMITKLAIVCTESLWSPLQQDIISSPSHNVLRCL